MVVYRAFEWLNIISQKHMKSSDAKAKCHLKFHLNGNEDYLLNVNYWT